MTTEIQVEIVLLEMYKVDVRVDAREAMAVARRRELEKQRQARVFNARERLIGVRQPLLAV